MSVLPVEGLNGSRVIDQRNHNIAIVGCIAGIHKNTVSAENAGIDHRLTANLQNEGFPFRNILCRNRIILLNILLCKNRLSGRNVADYRNADHLRANHLKTVITDLNSTRLRRVTTDISILLQGLEMRVNGRGRLQIHCLTDLANGGRVAPFQNFIFNIVQNLLLLRRYLTKTHMYHSCLLL